MLPAAAAQHRGPCCSQKELRMFDHYACRYENIVQIRCLLEGVTVEDMLQHWHEMLPQHMEKWQLDRQEVGWSIYLMLVCAYQPFAGFIGA